MIGTFLNSLNFLKRKPSKWEIAQSGEFDWWQGVARTGYDGRDRDEFIRNGQRAWLLSQLEFLEKPLDSWRDKVVVEFGSGPAGFVEYIDAARKIAVEPLIGRYRAEFPHLKTSSVEYYEVPAEEAAMIPSNVADLTICFNVLDHTYDPHRVLAHLARVAKKDSDLLFQVNVYRTLEQIKAKSGVHAELHPHSFLLDEISQKLAEHGFLISKSYCAHDQNPSGEYYFICAGKRG